MGSCASVDRGKATSSPDISQRRDSDRHHHVQPKNGSHEHSETKVVDMDTKKTTESMDDRNTSGIDGRVKEFVERMELNSAWEMMNENLQKELFNEDRDKFAQIFGTQLKVIDYELQGETHKLILQDEEMPEFKLSLDIRLVGEVVVYLSYQFLINSINEIQSQDAAVYIRTWLCLLRAGLLEQAWDMVCTEIQNHETVRGDMHRLLDQSQYLHYHDLTTKDGQIYNVDAYGVNGHLSRVVQLCFDLKYSKKMCLILYTCREYNNLLPEELEKYQGKDSLKNEDDWVMLGIKRKLKGVQSIPVFRGQQFLCVTVIPVTQSQYQENVHTTMEPNGRFDNSGKYLWSCVDYPVTEEIDTPKDWIHESPKFVRITHEIDSTMKVLRKKGALREREKKLMLPFTEKLSEEVISLYTQPTQWLDFGDEVVVSFIHDNNLIFKPSEENEVSFAKRALKKLHEYVTYRQGLPIVTTSGFFKRGFIGDCLIFSNAMTSILRYNKIVARTAIGCSCKRRYESIDKQLENLNSKEYECLNEHSNQYHCMCECYFKGLGWYLIEACNPEGVELVTSDIFLTKHYDTITPCSLDSYEFEGKAPLEPNYYELQVPSFINWDYELSKTKDTIPTRFHIVEVFFKHLQEKEYEQAFSLFSTFLKDSFSNKLDNFKWYLPEENLPSPSDSFIFSSEVLEVSISRGEQILRCWTDGNQVTGIAKADKNIKKFSDLGYSNFDFILLQLNHRRDLANNFLEFQKTHAGNWHVRY